MNEATADKVVDYILRTKVAEELTIRWFGGGDACSKQDNHKDLYRFK